jgi:hypothetical protein
MTRCTRWAGCAAQARVTVLRMRSLVFFAATLLACSGSSPGEEQTLLVFTDWLRVEASCGDYSFRGPPDIVEQEAQGLDSCREKWTTSSCDYAADYSGFASDLSEYQGAMGYQEQNEVISGLEAKLITAELEAAVPEDGEPRFVAAVTLPGVDPAVEGSRLTLDARCRSAAGQQDALSVFRTIVLAELQ